MNDDYLHEQLIKLGDMMDPITKINVRFALIHDFEKGVNQDGDITLTMKFEKGITNIVVHRDNSFSLSFISNKSRIYDVIGYYDGDILDS